VFTISGEHSATREWVSGFSWGNVKGSFSLNAAFVKRRLCKPAKKGDGLPENFRIHDLRYYFASLLIAAGLDIKTVQKRIRHSSAKTTLDTWPDETSPH
jgi:integrase